MAEYYDSIGASQAAAVMGLDPYKTPYALWREYVHPDERPNLDDVEAVQWGQLLQEPIANEAARRWNVEIRHNPKPIRHNAFPFMRASPDALVIGEPAGMEVKSRSIRAAAGYNEDAQGLDDATDAILESEACQCHHSLAVTGMDYWYLAVLIGGQTLLRFRIARDEAICRVIEDKCAEFWQYVQDGTPPPPTNSADAAKLWPRHTPGEVIEVTPDLLAGIEARRALKADVKRIDKELEGLDFILKTAMGSAEAIVDGKKPILTWKSQTRAHFDLEGFRKTQPDLAAEWTSEKVIRVMR